MRDMKAICEQLNIEVTEEQLIAGRFLESHGYWFCCNFGYQNCVQMADELFFEECLLLAIEPESSMIQ